MTASGPTPLAQRTDEKVRVLQETLHRATKADPKRTFGVLYDKVTQWEMPWLAWYRERRNRGAPGVKGTGAIPGARHSGGEGSGDPRGFCSE